MKTSFHRFVSPTMLLLLCYIDRCPSLVGPGRRTCRIFLLKFHTTTCQHMEASRDYLAIHWSLKRLPNSSLICVIIEYLTSHIFFHLSCLFSLFCFSSKSIFHLVSSKAFGCCSSTSITHHRISCRQASAPMCAHRLDMAPKSMTIPLTSRPNEHATMVWPKSQSQLEAYMDADVAKEVMFQASNPSAVVSLHGLSSSIHVLHLHLHH